MEADSRDFSALERQMELMQTNVANHATLVTSIGRAVAKVRGGWTRFTASEKLVIVQELRTAERCARQLYDSGLVHSEIAYAQGLVEQAAVYVAPVAPVVVEKPYETVKTWTGYEYSPGSGSEPTTLDYEVRKYATDDPKGEYQLWCNNRRERDYTADMKKESNMAVVSTITPSGAQADMSALLGRLESTHRQIGNNAGLDHLGFFWDKEFRDDTNRKFFGISKGVSLTYAGPYRRDDRETEVTWIKGTPGNLRARLEKECGDGFLTVTYGNRSTVYYSDTATSSLQALQDRLEQEPKNDQTISVLMKQCRDPETENRYRPLFPTVYNPSSMF